MDSCYAIMQSFGAIGRMCGKANNLMQIFLYGCASRKYILFTVLSV